MGDFQQEYGRALDLMVSGDADRAVEFYHDLLKKPLEPWQQSACYADLSVLYFALRKEANADAALEKAVALGFDDIFAFEGNPRARAALAGARLSPDDEAELRWLRDELTIVGDETVTLITENMARTDAAPTVLAHSQIPERMTASVAVLTKRILLAIAQKDQAVIVQDSDTSRIEFLKSTADYRQNDPDAGKKERESLAQAEARATERKAEVEKRRFVAS